MRLLLMWVARAVAAGPEGVTPLSALDADTPDADLAPFEALIGHAAVVGLGEGSHCGATYLAAKARLVRWLVERNGFRLVALETPWAGSLGVHRFVADGTSGIVGSLDDATSGMFWNFLDADSLSLYRWLAEYNVAHPDDPVAFVGFDVQDSSTTLLAILQRAGVSPDAVAACAAGPCTVDGGDPWVDEAVHGLEVRRALDAAGAGYGALRDREMADELVRLRREVAPGARTVVLAHDDHVGRVQAPVRRMGAYLADTLGDDYVPIGLVARDARTSCQGGPSYRGRHDVERAIGDAVDDPVAVIDLAEAQPFAASWRAYGRDPMVLGDAFDALVYFATVSPAVTAFWGDAPPSTASDIDGYGPWQFFVHDGPVDTASRDALWARYRDWVVGRGFAEVGAPRRTGGRGLTQRFTGEVADEQMTIRRASGGVGWRVSIELLPHTES